MQTAEDGPRQLSRSSTRRLTRTFLISSVLYVCGVGSLLLLVAGSFLFAALESVAYDLGLWGGGPIANAPLTLAIACLAVLAVYAVGVLVGRWIARAHGTRPLPVVAVILGAFTIVLFAWLAFLLVGLQVL